MFLIILCKSLHIKVIKIRFFQIKYKKAAANIKNKKQLNCWEPVGNILIIIVSVVINQLLLTIILITITI
jgi:hypothetical protein